MTDLVHKAASDSLPDAFWPVMMDSTELLLAGTGSDGRLTFSGSKFDWHNWFEIATLATVYTTRRPGNVFYQDRRVAELIGRSGRALVDEYGPEGPKNFTGWWWDNRPEEWVIEAWLLAYELLNSAGAGELTAGWKEPFLRTGETYHRYCQSAGHVRRMISPNLKISTNHFAWFAADLVRIGQLFENESFVQSGLETALKITAGQHPDGYWAESHGPTTSYNHITLAAIAMCQRFTQRAEFADAVQRAVEFHTRFSYPDSACLETIDQRVRYPALGLFSLFAFSDSPAGRGWAELRWRTALAEITAKSRRQFGRVAINCAYWHSGAAETPACAAGDYHAQLSDLPGGLVKRGPWVVGMSGIPSRSRNHLYTFDRQNLLSVWHAKSGLIIGGGNNRDNPQSATFYARVPNDSTAIVHGITHEDVYVPVDATLSLDAAGGLLDLSYYGFDAMLEVRAADDRTCRIVAWTGTLPVNEPVTLNLNLMLDDSRQIQTGAGQFELGDNTLDIAGEKLGGWVGQGGWRIALPAGSRLSYPMIPFRANPVYQSPKRLGLLSVPVTNRRVELTVSVE